MLDVVADVRRWAPIFGHQAQARIDPPGAVMTPATLVHLYPEMLHKYAQSAAPSAPCAAPIERKWAGVACVVMLVMAPVLIALAA
jgi:hypothetical protein